MSEQPRFSPQHIEKTQPTNTLIQPEEQGMLLRVVDAWCRFAGISKEHVGTSIHSSASVH